jgi:hypothetical protein
MQSSPQLAWHVPVIFITGWDEKAPVVPTLARMLQVQMKNVEVSWEVGPGKRFSSLPQAYEKADQILLCLDRPFQDSQKLLERSKLLENIGREKVTLLLVGIPPHQLPPGLQQYTLFYFSSEAHMAEDGPKLRDSLEKRLAARVPSVLRLREEKSGEVLESPAAPALLRLMAYAARINHARNESVDISFGALLYAFTLADDPISRWFSDYVRQARIMDRMPSLLTGPMIDDAVLSHARQLPLSVDELERPLLPSISTRAILKEAATLFYGPQPLAASRTLPFLDVHHVMAAYIYQPVNHEQGLAKAGFNRSRWSVAFLNQVARLYPQEVSAWKTIHYQKFPSEPLMLETEGPSTHIATDLWTLKDTLGYRAYAYAIYRFMTHKQTRPPLTVSIQAPWGGGKTSLMRMIQEEMDPGAFEKTRAEGGEPKGVLKIKEVLEELEKWLKRPGTQGLPPPPPASTTAEGRPQRLTVWFNAWKYESTNQVWAGLVDAVTQQVAARLPPHEREIFWLRLNMRRVDTEVIRQRVQERVFNSFWRGLRGLLLGLGVTLLTCLVAMMAARIEGLQGLSVFGGYGALLSVIGTGLAAALKHLEARKKVEAEPAIVSLREYLDVPDYGKELGFLHHAEVDLRRVIDSIPVASRPIVIFVDDLDRCSPANVARVVEAVNLFLAGDFPDCMFVLGMDTELVAAALQSTHKDLLAFLPADARLPLGWRFMDKFVQLPFVLPPPESEGVKQLTGALFSMEDAQLSAIEPSMEAYAHQVAARSASRDAVASELEHMLTGNTYDAPQKAQLQKRAQALYDQRKLDEGISHFTDKSEEMQQVISAAVPYFQGNPRELKRFVNAFRFHYFIWYAHRARGLEVPLLAQLVRWTVLSMKWPEVVRWLRRGGDSQAPLDKLGSPEEQGRFSRLRGLEKAGGASESMTEWKGKVLEQNPSLPQETAWVQDAALFQFFHVEGKDIPEGERLSAGAGKGLW